MLCLCGVHGLATEALLLEDSELTYVLGMHSSLTYLVVPSQDMNIHVALGS